MRPSSGRWSSAVAASSRARTSSADRPRVGRDDVLVGSGIPGTLLRRCRRLLGPAPDESRSLLPVGSSPGAGRPMAQGDGCEVGAVSGTGATCPLCGDAFVDDLAYSDHLRDIHDLVDEDGAEPDAHPPGTVALPADALASAAAALAGPEPDEPLAPPEPEPVPADAPATSPRRRPARLVPALALLAIVLVVGIKALSSPGDPDVDGGIAPGADGSLGAFTVTTTSSPPPTTAPPTTTTPRSTVRAVQARVLSCTRDGDTRTVVYSYVLSGSAADGPHEERLVARGHLVVASVRAPVPGGPSIVVPLEPGPVDCN